MRVWNLIVLPCVLVCAAYMHAAETPKLSEQDQKTAEKCLADLKSDTFDVRQAAEKQLSTLNAGAAPLLRDALTKSTDADFTASLHRVLKTWALETETDPVVLAGYAKEDAEAKNFTEAAKYYTKAATLFTKQSEQEKDKTKKDELASLAAKATERAHRADVRSKVSIQNINKQQIAIGGGGGNVVVKMTVSTDGGDAVDINKEDW